MLFDYGFIEYRAISVNSGKGSDTSFLDMALHSIYVMIYDRTTTEQPLPQLLCGVPLTVACHFWHCRFSGLYMWTEMLQFTQPTSNNYTYVIQIIKIPLWNDVK